MLDVQLTTTFQRWLGGLTDLRARIAIARRLERLAAGNAGDSKSVGEGVTEIDARRRRARLSRVLHAARAAIVIVLAGGDKSSQQRDIQRAQTMAKEY